MANIEQAIKWLREGKRVCRPTWDTYSYWETGKDEVINFGDTRTAHIHLKQLEADDWQLWKEPRVIDFAKKLISILEEEIKNGME